jgi:hypothetical protein
MRWLAYLSFASALAFAACSRPSETDCRNAVTNLQKLNDPEGTGLGPDPEQFVRKCRATGKKSTVACLTQARTIEEARACGGPQKQ